MRDHKPFWFPRHTLLSQIQPQKKMGFVTPTFKVSIYATNMEDTQKQPNEPGSLIKVRQHYKSV